MYNELDYVINTFRKNFNKEEPLILYGLGVATEGLLENIKDYNIVGLMDGKRKTGEQWGVKILDYDDVLSLNVKKIVVIAKQPAIPVIFHRIEKFCEENEINVYDINGMCLSEIYGGFENANPYFNMSMKDLKSEIERHDIISFDIFDTLLVRRILNPRDIFRYIEMQLKEKGSKCEFSFSDVRIQAEQNLLKRYINPNIYEIYDEFQALTGVTDEDIRHFIKKEIEVELTMIRPRAAMLQLFNEIKNRKKIYLVSDMYFPKCILDKILEKNGYQGYQDIFISCDYKKSKREGLFDYLEERAGKGETILHVGDNYSADVAALQGSSIDAFYIMSEKDMLANSSYRGILDSVKSVTDAIIVGKFVNIAFDNPFELYHTKGKLKIKNMEQYICLFLAPMVFSYSAWIMEKVEETKCDYVLYTSRDGYLIKKIVEIIKRELSWDCFTEGMYFYTSRRACLAATTYDYEDIKIRLLSNYKGDIYSLFRERFGIKIEEEAKDQTTDDTERILYYSKVYKEEILKACQKERENYLSYIKECDIHRHKRIAVIDLVAKGTVQNELAKLLSNCTLVGMYFFKTDADSSQINPDLKFCSLYKPQGKYSPDCPNVYRLYRQLELVLTSDEPTFQSMDGHGQKKFMKELRSEGQIELVKYMQQIILDYTQTIIELLDKNLLREINENLLDELLGLTDSQYSEIQVKELCQMVLFSETENLKFTVTENL